MPLPKSGNALYGESSHQSTSHEDLVRHFCQLPVVRTACSKAASAVLTYRRALVSASVLLPVRPHADGKGFEEFPEYRPRHSLEFRFILYYRYAEDILNKPHPGWSQRIVPETGRMYWHSPTLGSTWRLPDSHAEDLFAHRSLPKAFHPPGDISKEARLSSMLHHHHMF
jgi:hypothetical protein